MNAHALPPEIWLEIFDWACHNTQLLVDNHVPFEPVPDGIGARDPTLPVKVAIASVCSTWQTWIAESLYRDVAIRHGAHALQRILEGRKLSGRRYGEMVRRVVLPYPSTVAVPSHNLHAIEVLKLCPNIHTLLRPQYSLLDGLRFEFEAEGLALPSLQRLEWWHHSEAEQSGGINSLGKVLRNAPELRYLFIGGVVGSSRVCNESQQLILSHLETLRLHIRSGTLFYRILFQWSIPALKHFIMDSPPVKEGLDAIWDSLGDQLEIVELGMHVRFLMSDSLSPCLAGCPALQQLNYYMFFTAPPETACVHPNLTEVGLHAHVNGLLADGGSAWSLISRHFDFLCGPFLPALQKVILYGDWRAILSHPLFQPIQEKLAESGRVLLVSIRARGL